jgi:hypothetical protein
MFVSELDTLFVLVPAVEFTLIVGFFLGLEGTHQIIDYRGHDIVIVRSTCILVASVHSK